MILLAWLDGVTMAKLFPAAMGLTWLVGKISLKRIIRRLAKAEFSLWEVVAFLGIDLCVLSLSLWLGLRLHQVVEGSYEQHVMLYGEFAILTVVACCSYRLFLWTQGGEQNRWKRAVALGSVGLGLWVGSLLFVSTVLVVVVRNG